MLFKCLMMLLISISISSPLYAPLPETDLFGCAITQQNTKRLEGAAKAAIEDDVDSLTNYLSMGIDIDAPIQRSGATLLHCAAAKGSKNALQLLISMGANINVADKEGCTPITHAVYKKHTEIVKVLLANNATTDGFITGNGEIKKMLPQGRPEQQNSRNLHINTQTHCFNLQFC